MKSFHLKLRSSAAIFFAVPLMMLGAQGSASAAVEYVYDTNFTHFDTYNGSPTTSLDPATYGSGSAIYGQIGVGSTYLTSSNANGWKSTQTANSNAAGYNFVFSATTVSAGTAAGTINSGVKREVAGSASAGGYGNTYMWGAANGSVSAGNGGNNPITAPPTGNDTTNFLASDPIYQQGPISSTLLSNLTAGKTYTLTFWWAAAQQQNYTGPTYENWTVTVGSASSQVTSTTHLGSHNFSGWSKVTMNFTMPVGSTVNDKITFLSGGGADNGTNDSLPPFALLADVSLTDYVPEASSSIAFAVFAIGCVVTERVRRRRLAPALAV